MSIDDTIFDLGDIVDVLPNVTGAKEAFSEICKYITYLEQENERLTNENVAMRFVIKIVKGDNDNG